MGLPTPTSSLSGWAQAVPCLEGQCLCLLPTMPLAWGVLTDHSGWGLAVGESLSTWWGTRDITQLAVSVPALVLGGWTKGWGAEA